MLGLHCAPPWLILGEVGPDSGGSICSWEHGSRLVEREGHRGSLAVGSLTAVAGHSLRTRRWGGSWRSRSLCRHPRTCRCRPWQPRDTSSGRVLEETVPSPASSDTLLPFWQPRDTSSERVLEEPQPSPASLNTSLLTLAALRHIVGEGLGGAAALAGILGHVTAAPGSLGTHR